MIQINLLPPEIRREPPTSIRRYAVVAVSFIVALLSCIWYLNVHYVKLAEAQTQYDQTVSKRQKLQSQGIEKDHREIRKLVKDASAREESVEKIRYMRSDLSRKLYEFAQLLSNHPVWVDGLSITRANQDARSKAAAKSKTKYPVPVYKWSTQATCVGKELQTPITFFKEMEKDKFFKDFLSYVAPNFTKTEFPKEYRERIGYNFLLEMEMQIQWPEKKETKQK